jgi:hypothetical protein
MTDSTQQEASGYATAKRQFKAAMELMLAAGHSFGEFAEVTLANLGDRVRPYLQQFADDVREGRIKIKGLTKSALQLMRGGHVSAEQREAMIRETAYYLAERRDFVGGSAEEDWCIAEQEVDTLLGQQGGVINIGRKQLNIAIEAAEMELGNLRHAVTGWIEAHRTTTGEEKVAPRSQAKTVEQPATTETAEAKQPASKRKVAVKVDSKKAKAAVPVKATKTKKAEVTKAIKATKPTKPTKTVKVVKTVKTTKPKAAKK